MTEIVVALVGLFGSIVVAWLGYRQYKLTKDTEKEKEKHSKELEFIDDAMRRVESLENRVDTLHERMLASTERAEAQRRELIAEYEQRIESVRKEMRRLIDDANMELSMWRDKYFKLIDDYQKLKLLNSAHELKIEHLEKAYEELRQAYERKINQVKQSDIVPKTD